jgi:hypothetical protein
MGGRPSRATGPGVVDSGPTGRRLAGGTLGRAPVRVSGPSWPALGAPGLPASSRPPRAAGVRGPLPVAPGRGRAALHGEPGCRLRDRGPGAHRSSRSGSGSGSGSVASCGALGPGPSPGGAGRQLARQLTRPGGRGGCFVGPPAPNDESIMRFHLRVRLRSPKLRRSYRCPRRIVPSAEDLNVPPGAVRATEYALSVDAGPAVTHSILRPLSALDAHCGTNKR